MHILAKFKIKTHPSIIDEIYSSFTTIKTINNYIDQLNQLQYLFYNPVGPQFSLLVVF